MGDVYENTAYTAWLKNANERDILEAVLERRLDELHEWPDLSILEIGCGLGSAAKRLFSILDARGISYDYTGVDPYGNQLERFHDLMPEDRDIKLVQGTFDSFESDRIYGLGFIVHSLYYTSDMKSALSKMDKYSERMLIVHHGKQGINTIHEQFPDYVKQGPNTVTTYHDVAEALESLGIDYNLEEHETKVNIRPCKDPANEEGRDMIRFFLEDSNPSEDVIQEVSSFLRTLPDTMIHEIGIFFTKKKD